MDDMVKILGLDPGLNHYGYGAIGIIKKKPVYILSGIIKMNSSDIHKRLYNILKSLQHILTNVKPDYVAIEKTYVNKNPGSSLNIGEVRGTMVSTCLDMGYRVFEYPPASAKFTICGYGRATKQQIKRTVELILGKIGRDRTYDEYDALSLALCCFFKEKIRMTNL